MIGWKRKKEGEVGTEEEILDRGYRLGSRDRLCSSSTCPKAFGARRRSFRLVVYRSRGVLRDWFPLIAAEKEVLTGSMKRGFSRRRRYREELTVF